jgi:hypothetical protein
MKKFSGVLLGNSTIGKTLRLAASLLLILTVSGSAADKNKQLERVKGVPAIGLDDPGNAGPQVMLPQAQANAKVGPGLVIVETTYDYMTNNAIGRHIHNYGDGVMAIARTTSLGSDIGTWADRGTWFTYNDGTGFLPAVKVETARAGWGNISATANGRNVIVAFGGLRVNLDVVQGQGIWTELITGNFPTGSDLGWPLVVVDGVDNIHIVATHSRFDPFPGLGEGHYPVYARSTDQGHSWTFQFLFQKAGAAPHDPPDTTGGLWVGGGDGDGYAIDAWNNKVGVAVWAKYTLGEGGALRGQDIMFAESQDNGQTWTYSNITQTGTGAPPAEGDFRPTGHLTLVYDNNGAPHIVWGTFLALPDSAGQNANMLSFTKSPLMHWSPATGMSYVASRTDIPGGENTLFPSSRTWGRGLGSGVFWPSLGVGTDNKLYVVFSAPTPDDVDVDGVNYLDVYATASADGGSTWGSPVVNVTNSRGTEDKYASLAKLVDDSLRIVYGSDDVNGGIANPGNQTTSSFTMYYAFPAANVPAPPPSVVEDQHGDNNLPKEYFLEQNYPNPFNPSTEIKFGLPKSAMVKLTVYDITGRVAATLVNAKLPAGTHTATWNAGKSPSGIYFTKLESDGFSSVKRMMLVK